MGNYTSEQLRSIGLSDAQIAQNNQANQGMYDSFNTYNPMNNTSAGSSLSPGNVAGLADLNAQWNGNISEDLYANSATASGFNPATGTLSQGNGSSWDSFKGLFGSKNADGSSKLWGSGGIMGGIGSLLSGAGGIAGAVMAGKQAKLGRDMFDFQRGSYNEGNRLTAQSLNRQIADRQVADIAAQGLDTYTARRGTPAEYRSDNKVTPRTI